MFETMKLLLPALVPSWHFFKAVGASPRIEWALWAPDAQYTPLWQEFRPRPPHISPLEVAKRMFWNPAWNETLFLVSCAERWAENGTEHSLLEISNRVAAGLQSQHMTPNTGSDQFCFRIVLVGREGAEVSREVIYTSPPRFLFEVGST
jgi:hypothetical protein